MSLAVDSQESSGAGHHSTTSPLSWAFTNTAGNLLIATISVNATAGTGPSVSAVTYSGVSMTLAGSVSYDLVAGSNLVSVYIYYLVNPATGSNTISIAWSPGTGSSSPDALGAAISFSGANQSSPLGTVSTAFSNSATGTASVAVSGTTNGDYVVSTATSGTQWSGANAPTIQSAVINVGPGDAGDNHILGYQSTSGGSVTASFAIAASDKWGIAAVEVFAAPVGLSSDQMAAAAKQFGQIDPIFSLTKYAYQAIHQPVLPPSLTSEAIHSDAWARHLSVPVLIMQPKQQDIISYATLLSFGGSVDSIIETLSVGDIAAFGTTVETPIWSRVADTVLGGWTPVMLPNSSGFTPAPAATIHKTAMSMVVGSVMVILS